MVTCMYCNNISFILQQAAPGYYMAKLIIKLFNNIAKGDQNLICLEPV